jgi:hypothetical protein
VLRHPLAELIGCVQRAQDRPARRLLGAVVQRLLVRLLRGLARLRIGELIGILALRLKRIDRRRRQAGRIGHRLDLRGDRLRQRAVRRWVQLLIHPARGAELLELRDAGAVDAPGQPVDQRQIVG